MLLLFSGKVLGKQGPQLLLLRAAEAQEAEWQCTCQQHRCKASAAQQRRSGAARASNNAARQARRAAHACKGGREVGRTPPKLASAPNRALPHSAHRRCVSKDARTAAHMRDSCATWSRSAGSARAAPAARTWSSTCRGRHRGGGFGGMAPWFNVIYNDALDMLHLATRHAAATTCRRDACSLPRQTAATGTSSKPAYRRPNQRRPAD